MFSLVLAVVLATSATARAASDTNAAPRQLIVGFDSDTSRAESATIVQGTDASIDRRLSSGVAVVDVDPDANVAGVANELESDENVRYASPNYVVHATATASDPQVSDGTLWGLLRIHAPAAWDAADGTGTIVAVLDGGVNTANADIAPSLWTNTAEIPGNGVDDDNDGFIDDVNGADWVDRDGIPNDTGGHGTHVAGTIAAAADNNFGGAGVAPGAKIMPLRFLDGQGSGTIADAIAAVEFAIAHHADVINASWGGPDRSLPLRDAFARAGAAGITIVAAAGNDGVSNDRTPTFPAAFNLPNLIAVAASDKLDNLASFSNFGSSVQVAAPGVSIVSTQGAGTASMSGTSMAAPHVAGIAALLRSYNKNFTPVNVIDAITGGVRKSDSLLGRVSSGGVADAAGALSAAGAIVAGGSYGAAPGSFKLKHPGKKVRIRGRRGIVRFSWSRSKDTDLKGYELIVGGKIRATVKSTHARIKVPAGSYKWSVIALDAQGNSTAATRTSTSNGKISVLSSRR
ncbi:MAG: S8 family peptidase [Solirubrobacterales bacterium]